MTTVTPYNASPSHPPQCKATTNHYHAMCIWRPPPILVIHLKRFKITANGFIKLKSNVEYPLKDLDITDFMGKEKPVIPEADLRYWEALGGKREKAVKQKTCNEGAAEEQKSVRVMGCVKSSLSPRRVVTARSMTCMPW